MNMNDVLLSIKNVYEAAITSATFNGNTYDNGLKAKEALIRSQELINLLHNVVKSQLIEEGIDPTLIHPALNKTKPELKIAGFLKSKNQDICVVPRTGDENDKTIAINVRSQLSSMMKNIDTLYERTFAEALNLHLMFPSMCLGEVYLIPTHEYDDKPMLRNEVAFKKVTKLESYIKMFQAINLRASSQGDEYKYERVTLLIVDFRPEQPILYSSVEQLVEDGLLPKDTTVSLSGLTYDDFSNDLLGAYEKRFESNLILKV